MTFKLTLELGYSPLLSDAFDKCGMATCEKDN